MFPYVKSAEARHGGDDTTKAFFDHSSADRINTDAIIARSLKEQYPNLHLTVAPESSSNLLAYAGAGFAKVKTLDETSGELPSSLEWKVYVPPFRRLGGGVGALLSKLVFAKFIYTWKTEEFLVYFADGRDGSQPYPAVTNYYILGTDAQKAEALVMAAGIWSNELHEEVWVYDQGYWQKSPELYRSIKNASWDSVILDPEMKKAIIDDHLSFYESRDTYQGLSVPWKRGIIYYGPPGNGKTISIKAMMHTLYSREDPIPTLYVRSLVSYAGPEYAIKSIFEKARAVAPCYLVFEDLDTIVSDNVRSYFLNEVDGLKSNDGIFMVGSTNHLDRLDPGISKRPSRFDRKYLFPDPNRKERVAYCKFWQSKLKDSDRIDFPDKLCEAIADITNKFSFAYMQEAFVAALLAIARTSSVVQTSKKQALTVDAIDDWVSVLTVAGDDGDLDKLILWVEIKKQIKILREGLEKEKEM